MTLRKRLIQLLLVLLGLILVWLAWSAVRTADQARAALADLRQLEALAGRPSADALPALRADLAGLEQHLVATQAAGRPFLAVAPAFGWLPQVGPTVRDAPALLAMAIELAGGGRQALDALAPVADLLSQRGQGDLLARAVPVLQAAAPGLAPVEARFAKAEALRATIHGPLHPRLAPQMARLDRLLPLARTALRLAQVAPALLGADGPKTYLVLAQNNHELRGTGGFISGVGVVRLEGGRIVQLKLGDSYAVDNFQQPHPPAPPALAEQMGAQLLLLRDSNWSPDFPTSSQVARALYQQDQGVATDGALALDLEAVRLLVGALEPLQVPGMAEPVTGQNVIDLMKRSWEAPATSQGTVQEAQTSDWWAKRKDFMGEMVAAALAKLQGGGDLNPIQLATAMLAMLDGRHLQLAVDDPTLAAALAERNWDGGLRPPTQGDFLAVVDSNVGFNKVNAVVRQELAYRVAPDAGRLAATLTLTYTHPMPPQTGPCDRTPRYGDSYDDLIRRCYWDYLRVYAPAGSELLAADGLDQLKTERGEGNTTVFAGAFVLKPGEQRVITLRYRLPAAITSDSYRLAVRKQAGTIAVPLRVDTGACHWMTDLAQDRALECR
ncbi:MAG: DUF4012 domain-containing protein [Chloroflexi bacterium]|nr:DUF4012 domain-containing protein [Chloroflexota bacterium]